MKSQISLNSKRNRNRSISSESIPEEDENYMDEIIENIGNHRKSHEIIANYRKSYEILGSCFEILEKHTKS